MPYLYMASLMVDIANYDSTIPRIPIWKAKNKYIMVLLFFANFSNDKI